MKKICLNINCNSDISHKATQAKFCSKVCSRQTHYENNKVKSINDAREWNKNNPDRRKNIQRKEYLNNKDKYISRTRKYYTDNFDKVSIKKKAYYEKNKSSYNEKVKLNHYRRMKEDIDYRLKCNFRCRFNRYLKGKSFKKTSSISQHIGCSPQELRDHLQSLFTDGMTWDNYGKWHVDHIRPLNSAKDIDEAYSLFHYTNLQPLWAIDNIRKGCKY